MHKFAFAIGVAALTLTSQAAQAQIFGPQRSAAQRTQDRALAQLPECDEPLGSVTIADVDPTAYESLDLQPPQALLRLVVQRSGCFTLVDRGSAAMFALERERALANSGQLQANANMGGGQMRAADYILLAEVASENADVSGGGVRGSAQSQSSGNGRDGERRRGRGNLFGGLASTVADIAVPGAGSALGGLIGGGRIGGQFDARTGEANTVLSLVNVRTTETAAVAQGYAAKRDVNWGVGGSIFGGSGRAGGSIGGYENTEMGRVVTQAFIDAYATLVEEIRQQPRLIAAVDLAPEAVPITALPPAPEAAPPSARPVRAMRVTQTTTLRETPNGTVLRVMQNGQTVFPTGKAEGDWVEIIDEADEAGWVQVERLVSVR